MMGVMKHTRTRAASELVAMALSCSSIYMNHHSIGWAMAVMVNPIFTLLSIVVRLSFHYLSLSPADHYLAIFIRLLGKDGIKDAQVDVILCIHI